MEHWQRSEPTPPEATCVERIEVVVMAPNGAAAAKAAQVLLPEWVMRYVTMERDGQETADKE